MPLNPNHPFVGRRRSEITEEELEPLTEAEYYEYILWGLTNTLNHMAMEGVVDVSICPTTGEKLYTLSSALENQNN